MVKTVNETIFWDLYRVFDFSNRRFRPFTGPLVTADPDEI